MNDTLLAIKDIDKKESAVMPKFVAQHLDKLPRVTPGEIDVVSSYHVANPRPQFRKGCCGIYDFTAHIFLILSLTCTPKSVTGR